MKLLGCSSIADLNDCHIDIPAAWRKGADYRQPVG